MIDSLERELYAFRVRGETVLPLFETSGRQSKANIRLVLDSRRAR